MNPTAPSWIRGEISRVKSEDLLAGALPGQFVLRTKRGQGHVLSMVLPEEYDNKFRHHLIKAESGDFFIDKFGVGKHRSVENLISLLQTDTLGVLACPLQMAEFEEPTFEDHFNEPAGYDTAAGAGYGALVARYFLQNLETISLAETVDISHLLATFSFI